MRTRRILQRAASLIAAQLIFIFSVLPAHADVIYNVNTTADQLDQDVGDGLCVTATGACSLRAAVMQANHLTGPIATHIRLPAGNYVLTRPVTGSNGEDNGDLNFTSPLSAGQTVFIDGAAAATTIIDANHSDHVMSILAMRSVVLNRITIRGGFVFNVLGGGVYSQGNLRLADSVVEDNETNVGGGGIFSLGTLDIRRSTLRNNRGGIGGAVFATTLTVRESSLFGNLAASDGGAIYLHSFPATNTLVVVSSTISGNAANGNGGGIANQASAFIYSSSIINNDADHDRDELGGIGGGVWVNPGSRFVAVNSLLASNTVLDAPITDNCNGVLEVYGWNLLDSFDGCAFAGNGTAARGTISASSIGPLQNNGGPTWTHALLAGSEAIDATGLQGCIDDTGALLGVDQRGALRVASVACDVGAFEFGSPFDRIFAHGFD